MPAAGTGQRINILKTGFQESFGEEGKAGRRTLSQRVHVVIGSILRAQNDFHKATLGQKFIPYCHMDPVGKIWDLTFHIRITAVLLCFGSLTDEYANCTGGCLGLVFTGTKATLEVGTRTG